MNRVIGLQAMIFILISIIIMYMVKINQMFDSKNVEELKKYINIIFYLSIVLLFCVVVEMIFIVKMNKDYKHLAIPICFTSLMLCFGIILVIYTRQLKNIVADSETHVVSIHYLRDHYYIAEYLSFFFLFSLIFKSYLISLL